jgi:serine/threonine-protein kinase
MTPQMSSDPLIGRTFLDRYRVVRKLEARAGAALYLAQHLLEERALAVEVFDAPPAQPDAVDRFLEEARTLARVGHENVVEIFNGGRSPEGAVFLAQEHLEGTDLGRLLAAEGPLLWDRAQSIAQQLAAALGAAHRHGVVHGELRPENVLVVPRAGRRDFVKLLDFGLLRLRTAGGPGDARADVRGLGALIYVMVTGEEPAQTSGPPRPPSALRPAGTLPADLDAVVLRALEAEPEKRWPDMASFADALGRCRLTRRQSVRVEALAMAEQSGKVDAFEVDARRRRRMWSISSVAAAVVIAIAVLRFLMTAPGHVQISTVPADADLIFNGLPVQARSPVVLDAAPGRYTLVVSRAGYATTERAVDVAARGTVTVPVQLIALPTAPPPAANPPVVNPPGAAEAEVAAPAAAPPPAAAAAPAP